MNDQVDLSNACILFGERKLLHQFGKGLPLKIALNFPELIPCDFLIVGFVSLRFKYNIAVNRSVLMECENFSTTDKFESDTDEVTAIAVVCVP